MRNPEIPETWHFYDGFVSWISLAYYIILFPACMFPMKNMIKCDLKCDEICGKLQGFGASSLCSLHFSYKEIIGILQGYGASSLSSLHFFVDALLFAQVGAWLTKEEEG